MERAESKLAELLINRLLFEEPFTHLLEELREYSKYEIADELKWLISKSLVRPAEDMETGKRSGFVYDSDKLSDYSFVLTASGLNYYETYMTGSQD